MTRSGARDSGRSGRDGALKAALRQIEQQFGKGSMMRLGDREQEAIPSISTGSLGLDIALGIGGLPRGRVVEIYGPESSGKTTLTLQVIAEAQRDGGTCAFIDAEHAPRPGVRRDPRSRHGQPARVPARHRRAGPRDLRHGRALGRRGRGRHRLGRGAHAEGRDRGRDGRRARRPAGAAHEPGAPQDDGQHQELEHPRHLHQPDPHEDRRHVRLPRDHHRRQRAQVLLLRAPRHPPHRRGQGRRRGGGQRDPREGAEEQGRAAVQAGGVPDPLRPGHPPRRRDHRSRREAGHRREVRRLVQLQRPAHRPGAAQRGDVPERGGRHPAGNRDPGCGRNCCRISRAPATPQAAAGENAEAGPRIAAVSDASDRR